MIDLLVGCMVKRRNSDIEGLVVRTEVIETVRRVWVLMEDTGHIEEWYVDDVVVKEEYVKQLFLAAKKLVLLKKNILDIANRFELMDLDT